MILLTGGAGFLGGAVLTRLLARGEKVRVLALPGDPLARDLPEQAEVCAGDLLNPDDLDRFFALLASRAAPGPTAGALDFSRLDGLAGGASGAAAAALALALVGFGTKAGLVPLHVWLPEAHPAAPSHPDA